MKILAIVAAVACVAATPALAKPRAEALQSFAAAGVHAQDPYGVYVDGELIGRDPDPSVRAQIRAAYCGKFAPVGGAK